MANVNTATLIMIDHSGPTTDPNLATVGELAVAMNIDSAAVSVATSKMISTTNAQAPDSSSISSASSKASSAASQASVADSRAISGSVNTSVTDSKTGSNSLNTSAADSKAVSVGAATIVPTLNGVPGFLQSGTGAVIRTMNAKAADMVSVKDFGAVGNGVTDDTTAIRAAVAAAAAIGVGAGVFFPSGRYLTDEITVTTDGLSLAGAGVVRLLARANGQVILRIAASYCSVERFWLDANGHTTVDGLVLAPSNESDHLTRVDQNYNRIRHLHIEACTNGIRMRCGPGTVSGDSGCWYSTIEDTDIRLCTRGIWFQSCVTNLGGGATTGSLVNRNHFKNVRIGQSTNVGVHIQAAGTNVFQQLSCEGVDTGTSPITVPTGVYIEASDSVTGGNNDDNHFYGTQNEANTRDVYCDDPYTVFVGFNSIGGSKLAGAFFNGQGVGIFLNSAYVKQHLPGPLEYDPSLNSTLTLPGGWTCGVPLIPQQGVAKYGGKTALVVNTATVDLTLTSPRHPMLLVITTDANLFTYGVWMVAGDGSASLQLSSPIVNATGGSFSLAVVNATTLRITNSTGSPCHFSWGACPFGPAL